MNFFSFFSNKKNEKNDSNSEDNFLELHENFNHVENSDQEFDNFENGAFSTNFDIENQNQIQDQNQNQNSNPNPNPNPNQNQNIEENGNNQDNQSNYDSYANNDDSSAYNDSYSQNIDNYVDNNHSNKYIQHNYSKNSYAQYYLEEPWTDDKENLLIEWRKFLHDMEELHEEAGYRLKKKNMKIKYPTFVFSLSMTFVQGVFEALTKNDNNKSCEILSFQDQICECNFTENYQKNFTYVTITNGVMWLLYSILLAVNNELDLGAKLTLHFQYSSRYKSLITSIDSELAKNRKFRKPSDSFINEIRLQIGFFSETEPDFPVDSCC